MLFFKKSLKQLVTEYHIKQEENNIVDMNTRRSTGSNMRKNINNSSTYNMSGTSNKNLTSEWYEKNTKICGLVSQHPYMYDRSHPDYMRKSSVDIAWKDISLVMGDSVRNCKERWRNIRTSFARSINVHRASGSNRIKPYYLTNELQFLKKHITPGVPIPIRGRRSRGSNPNKVSNYGDDGDGDGDDDAEEDEEEEEEDDDEEEEVDEGAGDGDDDDDNIDDEENDVKESKILVEMKHSLSSNENSRDSSALADMEEHAQSYNDSNGPNKEQHEHEHDEMLGQSTGDESYQLHNSTNKSSMRNACPPKKRQRLTLEKNKVSNSKKKNQSTNSETPVPPPPTVIDFDDAFLQSLRPEIKHMNFHQKLYFKRRVYDLLGEIFQNTESSSSLEQHHHTRPSLNGGGGVATTPSVALQHLGLTLQLPKLVPRTTKDS